MGIDIIMGGLQRGLLFVLRCSRWFGSEKNGWW